MMFNMRLGAGHLSSFIVSDVVLKNLDLSNEANLSHQCINTSQRNPRLNNCEGEGTRGIFSTLSYLNKLTKYFHVINVITDRGDD